jgi:AraC-like DNA-binding protein/ligand-binding sensor protein
MSKYNAITRYLELLTNKYNLDVCVNDFEGFLSIDPQLALALQPYMIHRNQYCMQIKSDEALWHQCIRMKYGLLDKSRKLKKCFLGMCYCGIEEYIVPIICEDIVIGVICVGEFNLNQKKSFQRIARVAKSSGMDLDILRQKFLQSTMSSAPDIMEIEALLGIVAEHIASVYTTLASTYKDVHNTEKKSNSSATYILYHSLEYIKQNFADTIAVKDICNFCHCSESYINHIFKKNMKINVKGYINKLRIEQSKEYLLNSNLSIADIAMQVGYSDPNYFSVVFSKICGISPTEYKKRFSTATI